MFSLISKYWSDVTEITENVFLNSAYIAQFKISLNYEFNVYLFNYALNIV